MPEKKSTSANSKSVADNTPDGRNLGRASYRAEQARDAVIIFAFGWHPTPGYVDFFEQSPIDIFPPQFIFHTIPPSGMWPQVLAPFAIWVMFGASDPIKTVTVHDADGPHEVPVEQMSKAMAAAKGRDTWVSGNVVRGGAGSRATTLGLGEEEPGPTTWALGEEEFRAATTMAVGEEGGGPTTMATGEESFSGPTTMAVGEEGGPTTMALGEENPTTDALGEEGPTTMALGEETTAVMRTSPFGTF
jgi:hypothetical protein